MREGSEVTTGADSPLLRDPGETRAVEGVNELLQSLQGYSGVAFRQNIDSSKGTIRLFVRTLVPLTSMPTASSFSLESELYQLQPRDSESNSPVVL